jgi:hypothetical protein
MSDAITVQLRVSAVDATALAGPPLPAPARPLGRIGPVGTGFPRPPSEEVTQVTASVWSVDATALAGAHRCRPRPARWAVLDQWARDFPGRHRRK